MRIIFAGTPEIAVPSLRAVAAAGHDIVGVITRDDAPLGRKRVLTASPVAAAAQEMGVPLIKANSLGQEAVRWAADLAPDLGVVVAYGGLLREPLLSVPPLGWVNLHFSELPQWRGAAPVQRALMAGQHRLGVTVFRLVAALDAGPVLTRDTLQFAEGTSAGHALRTLAERGTTALTHAINLLGQSSDAGEPQTGEPTYAHKLTREDGLIDLTQPRDRVLAHWAGVTPEPGAFVMLAGQPLKLLHLTPTELSPPAHAAPGSAHLVQQHAVLVLADGVLEIARVQPAGKPAMSGADWLRGRGSEVGFV